mmetsp:Transcript_15201/g.28925  ORF Transcript_15201/g.28925 Transcript_15201/m.28925 type:complete len:218 (+) Transcript_15201:1241-1894(+)
MFPILAFSCGSTFLMCPSSSALSRPARYGVPQRCLICRYLGWDSKNASSALCASAMRFFWLMSAWERLTTGTNPSRKGITFPLRTSMASVPRSMRSSFVRTPSVRDPSGSTSLASFSDSELARSAFAGETATMMELGLRMYLRDIARICCSMLAGWSPTGFFVIPGKSTRDRERTCGENILRWIALSETPLLEPVRRSVSRLISFLISSKSKNLLPF